MQDPFALSRFVDAQDPMMGAVEAELRAGHKTNHWMWFVFPQLRALGRSGTAQHFGITGIEEARAYAQHPILGPRLIACAKLVLNQAGRASAQAIFGETDAMKLRSCMTLFAAAAPEEPVFDSVLAAFFEGVPDPITTRLLETA